MSENILPKLPQSPDAERSVLGAMIQDEKALTQASESLKAEDFFIPAHREIFSAMLQVMHSGMAVDLITGKKHDFGGGSRLPAYSAAFWKMEK